MPTVRNGRTIHENVHQQRFFEHYEANGYTPMFDAAMTGLSSLFAPAIVDGYDFGTLNSLVDIAGGEGALLAEILKANPSLRGALYERPEVIERAQSASVSRGARELQSRDDVRFRRYLRGDTRKFRRIFHEVGSSMTGATRKLRGSSTTCEGRPGAEPG